MLTSGLSVRGCVARIAACVLALALCAGAAMAADPGKVLRYVFPAGEEGFDPAAAHDLYSGTVEQAIFETLLTYDYLARPAKLVPMAAEALPQVTDDGKTYTFKVRKGIYFTPDPAFKGARRELVAEDFAFSLKRLVDPAIHSPWAWLVEGKIVGLDAEAAKAKKAGKFDYNAKIAGLEVVDRYTLRIRLTQPDYNMSYVLAHEPTSAVAKEVVAAYGDEGGRIMSNPVGTGAYMLAQWVRSSKIVLEANPDYRGFVWDFQPGSRSGRRSHRRRDEGQEDAPDRPHRDQHHGGGPVAAARLPERRARPHEHGGPARAEGAERRHAHAGPAKKGVRLSRFVDPEITYTYWNLMDPVVGGLTPEKIALRRAMAMSYPVAEEIKVIRNGQAIEAQFPVPPGRGRQRSGVALERQVRSCRGQRAARQVRLQEGRGRLAHASGRQAARRCTTRRARIRWAASRTSSGRRRSTRSASGWKCARTSSPSS